MRPKHTSLYFFAFAFVLCSFQLKAQYITTFAGTGTGGYTGDGGPAFGAELFNPTGVATYGYVTQYIADQANHVIRKVDFRHNISTFAGNDTTSYNCDGCDATSASLNHPYGIALDVSGNLYIADAQNNVIRKVDGSGIISTYAGTGYGAGLTIGHGGYTGDGGLASAERLNFPEGVAVDIHGSLYIADASNDVIRKVSASDTITTYAGNGSLGYGGDGGAAHSAQLNFPTGIAVDGLGNVYIADQGNNTIREVSPAGIISTISGRITSGYNGDGGM